MPDMLPEILERILTNLNYQQLLDVHLVSKAWYDVANYELKRRLSHFFTDPSQQAISVAVDFLGHLQPYQSDNSTVDGYCMSLDSEYTDFQNKVHRSVDMGEPPSLKVNAERLGPPSNDHYDTLPSRSFPRIATMSLMLQNRSKPGPIVYLLFDGKPSTAKYMFKDRERRRLQAKSKTFRCQRISCFSPGENFDLDVPQRVVDYFTVDLQAALDFEAVQSGRWYFRGVELKLQIWKNKEPKNSRDSLRVGSESEILLCE